MRWRPVLVVPLALVVLGACGDDDDGGGAVTIATPVTTTVPTTASSPPDTVTRPGTDVTTSPAAAPTTTIVPARPAPSPTVPAVVPEGFAARSGVITAVDGTVCDVCLWVAETPADRVRGLMGVTDLGGADGMVFVWDEPTQGNFWMRGTPTPLSIAFFAADGSFVSATDMVPCLDGPDEDCARYAAAGPYQMAIEVPLGGLAGIAAGPGSLLELLDGSCVPGAGDPTP